MCRRTTTTWPFAPSARSAPSRNVAAAPPGDGVAVAIDKHIPVAGGMAGGSADAAAALVACNELWGAGLSQAELCEVAATSVATSRSRSLAGRRSAAAGASS